MYLIRKSCLNRLPLISDSFMLNLEIPIRIAQQGKYIPIAEIEG